MYKKLTELSEGEYKQLCDDHTRLYETLTITEMKLGELQYNLKHIKANQKKIFMKILGFFSLLAFISQVIYYRWLDNQPPLTYERVDVITIVKILVLRSTLYFISQVNKKG